MLHGNIKITFPKLSGHFNILLLSLTAEPHRGSAWQEKSSVSGHAQDHALQSPPAGNTDQDQKKHMRDSHNKINKPGEITVSLQLFPLLRTELPE